MINLKVKHRSIIEWNVTLAISILVCIPSLKLFYSTSIFNLLPLAILALNILAFFGNPANIKPYTSKSVLIGLFLICFVLIVTVGFVFFEQSAVDFKIIAKYFVMLSLLILIMLQYQYLDFELFLNAIITWAILLGLYHLLIGFNFDSSKGQHYLTLGLPMGAGMTVAFISLVTEPDKKKRRKFLYLTCFLFTCILLSRARSSLLFPIIIVIIYLMASATLGPQKKKSLLILGGIVTVLVCGYLYLSQFTNLHALQRIQRSSSSGFKESRTSIWIRTIDLINENPFGYGVDSYHELLGGSYPHNIFLEMALSFGFVGLILILVLTFVFLFHILILCGKGGPLTLIRFGFLAMYYFFCWNTSYDLSTSYIPLSMMIIFVSLNNRYPSMFSSRYQQDASKRI